MTPNIKEQIVEEFKSFKLEEYGKWKIGRAEAERFLLQALTRLETATEERVIGEIREKVKKSIHDQGFEMFKKALGNLVFLETLGDLKDKLKYDGVGMVLFLDELSEALLPKQEERQ